MFEKFTERARKCLTLARQWAQQKNSEFIGTEHFILGILEEGGGVAAKYLKKKGVDVNGVVTLIDLLITPSTSPTVTLGTLPFSPRAKRVIELAEEEMSKTGVPAIGTEQLLVALILESEGIAAQVLRDLKVSAAQIGEIYEVIGLPARQGKTEAPPEASKEYEVGLLNEQGEVTRTLIVLKEPGPYHTGWRLTEAKTGNTLYWCGSLTYRECPDPVKVTE